MARERGPALRRDVKDAIERIWPDGVVDTMFDSEESYFWKARPRLTQSFRMIKGVRLIHEREADGRPIGMEGSDPDEDTPYDVDYSRSYHLFFLSPEGEAFGFEAEDESFEDDPLGEELEETSGGKKAKVVCGKGRIGYSVAVSLLAPFAVITMGEMITFEDGTISEPEIELFIESREGEHISQADYFQRYWDDRPPEMHEKLQETIISILGKNGITVLPEEEWRKPVSWLKGGEAAFVGPEGQPIRVLDALFFEGL